MSLETTAVGKFRSSGRSAISFFDQNNKQNILRQIDSWLNVDKLHY